MPWRYTIGIIRVGRLCQGPLSLVNTTKVFLSNPSFLVFVKFHQHSHPKASITSPYLPPKDLFCKFFGALTGK